MISKVMKLNNWKKSICFTLFFLLVAFTQFKANAQNTPLRRPITPDSPTWVIHIDVWVNADPRKIIEIVPEDIRPYVIFNLSLSVSEPGTGPYGPYLDPFSILESWIRACAEYGVWASIQTASGWQNNLPYTHTADDEYEYFYKNYPNFVGYNFCEQCWGFPSEAALIERIKLFTDLLELGNRYGGYLFVSHAQTINAPDNNAVAFLKKSRAFLAASKNYKDNYVVLEKYTSSRGFYDVESTSLGCYLSGYSGNYGIRFDDCGWNMFPLRDNSGQPFPEALGIIPIVEHAILTGQTVSDGPELTWVIAIGADGNPTGADGYKSKRFKAFPNFTNNNLDVFRKMLDGSFRIPTREEVIERTKIAYVTDVNTGTNPVKYSSEESLFTGLYAMDREYSDNNMWTKKTGRYPTIPTIYKEGDYETGGFESVVKKSDYSDRWSTIEAKVEEFNSLFPEEYTGDIYAARINNTWVTYNPYMNDQVEKTFSQLTDNDKATFRNMPATGTIPFKYNTCEKIELTHANYGLGVINEFSDKLEIYLNNFSSKLPEGIPLLREDVIKIYGSTTEPTYTYTNRGGSEAGEITITPTWENGVYTLTVKHNGPLDITLNCAGNAIDRLKEYPQATQIVTPAAPPAYTGSRQVEAEDFEYKNISGIGYRNATLKNYTALGYVIFGTSSTASMRTSVNVLKDGTYKLKTRYCGYSANINTIDVYINDVKVVTPTFTKTNSPESNGNVEWEVNVQEVQLKAGDNKIEFRANKTGTANIFFDNIVIEPETIDSIEDVITNNAVVVSEEYYTLMGQKIYNPEPHNLKGIYVIKSTMSDGSVQARKVYLK